MNKKVVKASSTGNRLSGLLLLCTLSILLLSITCRSQVTDKAKALSSSGTYAVDIDIAGDSSNIYVFEYEIQANGSDGSVLDTIVSNLHDSVRLTVRLECKVGYSINVASSYHVERNFILKPKTDSPCTDAQKSIYLDWRSHRISLPGVKHK